MSNTRDISPRIDFDAPVDGWQSPQVNADCLIGCYVVVFERDDDGVLRLERRGQVADHPLVHADGSRDFLRFKVEWWHFATTEDNARQGDAPVTTEIIHRDQMGPQWRFTTDADRFTEMCAHGIIDATRGWVLRMSSYTLSLPVPAHKTN